MWLWTTFTALYFLYVDRAKIWGLSAPYVAMGCYADTNSTGRPLPDLLQNFYYSMTWNDIEQVIQNCSVLARRKGHRYFGLQQYGECWSGKDAGISYARDGPSDACVKGVGKTGSNFVYKFVNGLDQSCELDWHPVKDTCFYLSRSGASITSSSQASQYCTMNRGLFHLAETTVGFLIQDRLIKTLQLNKQLNNTDCLVLSNASVAYSGVFSSWNDSTDPSLSGGHTASSLGTGYECAVKDVHGEWYHHQCDLKTCKIMCSRHRDIQPTQGTFSMKRRNAVFVNNKLLWQLVDDATQCARECLVTDTCASFNYEYRSRAQVVGALCSLNSRKMSQNALDLKDSADYNYYERLK